MRQIAGGEAIRSTLVRLSGYGRRAPWPALIAGLACVVVSATPWWHGIESDGFDSLTVITAPNRAELPITLIAIDEESLDAVGRQWPWPRGTHARLLDRLREAGAAVVAFDVLFAEAAADPDEDQAFARAIRDSNRVVLAADLEYRESAVARQWTRTNPQTRFLEAGAVAGLASFELDRDGVLRRFPMSHDALWRQVLLRFTSRMPGVVARLDPQSGQRIRYLGPPHTFSVISYHRMLDPDRLLSDNWRDFLRDNIVIVGRAIRASTELSAAQADLFLTPFFSVGGELMSGAEVHANLIANMITGDTLREVPRSGPLMLVIGVSLLAAGLMARWHPVHSALAAIGLSAMIAGGCWYLFRQGVWLPATGAIVAPFLAYLAQGGRAFFEEQARRKAIRSAFARYVPPAVVDEIAAHPERLRLNGERREITVMFTDLAGFTTISESSSAEEVAHLLNRHFSDMTEIVMRHGGTVDKFIGDAVMAFWGAPMVDSEQSLHAIDAAVEMQRKMAEVRAEVLAAGGPRLSMRIGVHRGDCIVGNMGGAHRFEYTAVGDTVNLASRLEGVNKIYGTEILLSERACLAIAGDRRVRPVDCVTVKGRREPVMLYTPCEDVVLTEATQAAFAAYREGHWDRSRELWERLSQSYPDDPLVALFLARLRERGDRAPPPGWDGITLIDSK